MQGQLRNGQRLSRQLMGVVNACGQGVKHEDLLGLDLDRSRGWEYR